MDASLVEEVTARVDYGETHASIAAEQQHRFPERRGFHYAASKDCALTGVLSSGMQYI